MSLFPLSNRRVQILEVTATTIKQVSDLNISTPCTCYLQYRGPIVVVIVQQLDLQLPMQSVPITTNVKSLNPTQARSIRYNNNAMWQYLSMNCDRSVVFSGYSGSSKNKIDRHDITKILLKVVLNTITPNLTHPTYSIIINNCLHYA